MPVMTRNNSSSDFQNCPEGTYIGALADIVDAGYKERVYNGDSKGLKPRIQLVWLVNELNDEGKPFMISEWLAWSLDPKATLYKRLSGWIGAAEVERMLEAGEDLDTLIGRNAMISVEHNESGGKVYANVAGVIKPAKGTPEFTIDEEDYKRRCLRPDWEEKKPLYSAFEFLPEGVRIGSDGFPLPPDDLDPHRSNSGQAAKLNEPAKAVTPNEPPVRQPSTAEQAKITDQQKEEIIALAMTNWGPGKWTQKLKEFLKGHYTDLSADSAAKAINDLRDYKPTAAEKVSGVPKGDIIEDDDTQGDIFDDQPVDKAA